MAVRVYRANRLDFASAVTGHLRKQVADYGRATLIVSAPAARERVRRVLADAGLGLGVDVLTPASWLSQVWDLVGDGRAFVSAMQRRMIMEDAVERAREAHALEPLLDSPGTVRMLDRMARELVCPMAATVRERAVAQGAAGIDTAESASERRVFELVDGYARALDARGLVEPAEAAELIGRAASGDASALPGVDAQSVALPAALASMTLLDVSKLSGFHVNLLAATSRAGAEVSFVLSGGFAMDASLVADAFTAVGADVTVGALEALPADGGTRKEDGCEHGRVFALDSPEVASSVYDFLEVSGPHAKARSYANEAVRMLKAAGARVPQRAHVVVASARPSALARELVPYLSARKVACEFTQIDRFLDTCCGRAFSSLVDIASRMADADSGKSSPSVWWPAPEITDWLYNPISGADAASARGFDKKIRSTRAMSTDDVRRYLQSVQGQVRSSREKLADDDPRRNVPCVCADVLQFIEQKRPVSALRAMASVAEAAPGFMFGTEDGFLHRDAEFTMAARAAELVSNDAHELGISQSTAVAALDGLCCRTRSVAYALDTASADEGVRSQGALPLVSLMTLADSSELARGSVDGVLLADMDVMSYPLSHDEGPLVTLAERFGMADIALEPATVLDERVARAAAASRGSVVLARVTHDRQAKKRFPAAAWTELLVASSTKPRLVGEGDIVADFDPAQGEGLSLESVVCEAPQHLSGAAARYTVLRQRKKDDPSSPLLPRLTSASQIESYVSCPLCWFISSRVRPQTLDAGFGGMEKGNFVHDVLCRLHQVLPEEGIERVTPENLDRALSVLDRVFDEVRAEHAAGKTPSSAPLVPLSSVESAQIDEILPQLKATVRYEARALAPFKPAYLEYSFNDLGVTYAGYPLGGRIDRVDVDGEGRAVVIDYKHRADVNQFKLSDPSIVDKDGKRPIDDPRWLPEHTQTLIYAQALRRALGLDPVAALYFSTKGNRPAMRGAASDALVDPEHGDGMVPGLRDGFPGAGGSWTFDELLDYTEEGIAQRLREMEAGVVAASPDQSGRCAFNHPFGFTRREA